MFICNFPRMREAGFGFPGVGVEVSMDSCVDMNGKKGGSNQRLLEDLLVWR